MKECQKKKSRDKSLKEPLEESLKDSLNEYQNNEIPGGIKERIMGATPNGIPGRKPTKHAGGIHDVTTGIIRDRTHILVRNQ